MTETTLAEASLYQQFSIATAEGRKALSSRPINATRGLIFPHFSIKQEEWGVNGVLWLAEDDFVMIDLADSETLSEALIAIAFHQLESKTLLYIDEETIQQLNAIPELANMRVIDEDNKEIPLVALLKTEQVADGE